ncbi:MAG TPA: Holliday junction resolvase RuvX [Bacteroidia bacterium]|nr:Holliday junction resolvase RuvX [Bacteroidia bacterium]
MGRIIGIDYGTRRVGLAVTDPLQLIATDLATVAEQETINWLKDYLKRETVDRFVVGEPRQTDGSPSETGPAADAFAQRLARSFPDIPIDRFDERFTSRMAQQAIIQSGVRKKGRQDKGLVDRVSAVILLQSWMEARNFKA